MDTTRITVYLTTRQTRPDGQFLCLNDPDDLLLEVLAEQVAEKPDAKTVCVYCPRLHSDPSGYSYSWYLKYSDLTFEFAGLYAAHFEKAAKAARARRDEG